LAAAFDDMPRATVQKALAAMMLSYATDNRGLAIEEVAGGYQMRTPKDHAGYVAAVTAAAGNAVAQGFLLQVDADALIAQATASAVLNP